MDPICWRPEKHAVQYTMSVEAIGMLVKRCVLLSEFSSEESGEQARQDRTQVATIYNVKSWQKQKRLD